MSQASSPLFNLKDYVVYPQHGIGIITEVFKDRLRGQMYRVKLLDSGMLITIPLKSLKKSGLRRVMKKNQVKQVLEDLTNYSGKIESNWRVRFQENVEKIKSGQIEKTTLLIKELFLRNKRKALSAIERKQYENTFELLIKEITLVTGAPEDEVNSLLSSKLDELTPPAT